MRACPICESIGRKLVWHQTFLVPEKWTQPAYLDWFVCRNCGMTYGDNPDITQRDYDKYYNERYGFGVEDAEARQRQQNRAQMISTSFQDKSVLVVDFGGVGILSGYLKDYGFSNVVDIGAGEKLPSDIDCLVAEHVLEHIYSLPEVMREISSHMKIGAVLIVDGPESAGIAERSKMPMLDWHQKHINHFTYFDYMNLMRTHGFEFVGAGNYIERGNPCMHMVFGRAEMDRVALSSVTRIKSSTEEMLKKLREISGEVVVWGCGDVALHLLSIYRPNIKYFVDKDPALKGATIAHKLVFDTVALNEPAPIVVIAQSQRDSILSDIRAAGLRNKLIIL